MNTNYKYKYIKYKQKYIQLVNSIGGDISVNNQFNRFPYQHNYIDKNTIRKIFNKLINYEPVIEHNNYRVYNITFVKEFLFNGKPTILVKSLYSSDDFSILSDYFQENCRIKCKRYDQDLSPYDYWLQNKDKIISYATKNYGNSSPKNLREAIYNLTRECTSFRPTIVVSIVKMFNSRVILDFSAGWGDRLIGAMACDNIIDFYCGVDPNSCVHPNYQRMIKFFKKDPKKYHMIHSPFQTAKIPNKKYDLILTSPPYFTLEKYTNEDTQSISSSDSLDSWLHDFLFFSLNKCWTLLIPGGYMVININDMKDTPGIKTYKFVEQMINYINKLDGSNYLGVISYAKKDNNKYISPQPLWIWNKIAENVDIKLISLSKISNEELNKLSNITTNINIMNNIGIGTIWNMNELLKKKEEEIKDRDSNNQQYYKYYVKKGNDVIGYISLRPLSSYTDLQIRIIIYPLGKRYGSKALKILTEIYNKPILSVVSINNKISNNLFKNWNIIGTTYYKSVLHNIYKNK